uniref:cyanidin-3-O-glucoside 2-O-glucuronosyltransferase-like n=1 Tax=Erigeron canadensis TaxID=72917 RepID=UPI001CB97576|nr:cyanidin-3-O-glucoside 2-O-glucuronosyltransferase-like [Erigeron canadensis]
MDSTNESSNSRYRVILLPWLAYSHISRFLAFGKGLANHKCFDIYLCSSQVNLQTLRKNLPERYSQSITLVELNLPSSSSLPLHYHTTNGLPPHLLKTLTADYAKSFPGFEVIIQNIRPHLLIYDFSQLWAIDAATSMNIPSVMFLSGCVPMFAMGVHSALRPSSEKFPFPEMYFKDHEIAHMKAIGRHIPPPPTGEIKTTSHPFFECINRSRDIILVKSTRELAGKYIDYMSQVVGKKVLPVGPLVEENSKEAVNEHVHLFQWLDKKEESSVVFVSFGSEYFLSDNDIEDIAFGLELSQVISFIWVIRSPEGAKTRSVEQVLPHGFLERIGDRGMVTDKWLPQAKILSHSSTGGFISHCGWGSVMESIHYGVPVIAMPMQFDQPFNARLVETLEVGIDVSRDGDGRLKREEMAEVLKKVVVEDSGATIRKNAKELGEIMRNKMDQGVDKEVIENLIKLCQMKN